LVIDDPLLKPRYGFLKFLPFLRLMQRHDFATSIAFIPWNWRRSATKSWCGSAMQDSKTIR
jgi:hypothetical protein